MQEDGDELDEFEDMGVTDDGSGNLYRAGMGEDGHTIDVEASEV